MSLLLFAAVFFVMARVLEDGVARATVAPVLGLTGEPCALTQGRGTVLAGIQANGSLPLNICVVSQEVGFHQSFYRKAQALHAPGERRPSVVRARYFTPFGYWLMAAEVRPHDHANFWSPPQYWTARPVQWR